MSEHTEQLHLTHRVLRLFTNPDMVKLLPALEALQGRLERYAAVKNGEWERVSPEHHIDHAHGHHHIAESATTHEIFVTNLVAAGLRELMALTRYLELCDQDPHGRLMEIRGRAQ